VTDRAYAARDPNRAADDRGPLVCGAARAGGGAADRQQCHRPAGVPTGAGRAIGWIWLAYGRPDHHRDDTIALLVALMAIGLAALGRSMYRQIWRARAALAVLVVVLGVAGLLASLPTP
jgi:hypothetical protein